MAEEIPKEEVKEEVVEEPEDRELTEEDIRNEINRIMNQIDVSGVEKEIEDPLEGKTLEESSFDSIENEEPVREVPIIAPEREESIEEDLHYDYSDVTEKDIDSVDSKELLAEMKKALEAKKQEVKAAEEEANKAEKELKLSFDEVEEIRRKAVEKENAKQETVAKFEAYVKSYDKDIEEARTRKEKAEETRTQNEQEIADYEADIASNDDLMKNLISMMGMETVEEEDDIEKRM